MGIMDMLNPVKAVKKVAGGVNKAVGKVPGMSPLANSAANKLGGMKPPMGIGPSIPGMQKMMPPNQGLPGIGNPMQVNPNTGVMGSKLGMMDMPKPIPQYTPQYTPPPVDDGSGQMSFPQPVPMQEPTGPSPDVMNNLMQRMRMGKSGGVRRM